MKLLIVTQVIDSSDANLGFFHTWVKEFAAHCDQVSVICLRKGSYTLPDNVHVYSLGKERRTGRLTRIWLFYSYIFKLRSTYDAVFVHMNPEYIVLGGYLWRRWNKSVALWYAHRSDTRMLRRAIKWATYIFTVSESSFSIPTPKLRPMGHGIDTELFRPQIREGATRLRVMTAGRIAQSKHLLEMLGVLHELYARGEQFIFTIVGAPITKTEEEYALKLKEAIEDAPWKSQVVFAGPVPHAALPEMISSQDVFFNFATTGNMDKAGLEALAAGVPLLTTNVAFEPLLAPYGLYISTMNPKEVADTLLAFMSRGDQPAVMATLRNKVVAEHSLAKLIPRILEVLVSSDIPTV